MFTRVTYGSCDYRLVISKTRGHQKLQIIVQLENLIAIMRKQTLFYVQYNLILIVKL